MAFVLIGFMGAGKSTAARELADALRVAPQDSDAMLEAHMGHSVAREFELHGEAGFREQEEQLVRGLLEGAARVGHEAVIALGGGSVLSAPVRSALAPHTTILLDVDAQTAWERVGGDGGDTSSTSGERPLARDRRAFFELHARRQGLYGSLADAIVPASSPRGELPRGGITRALPALRSLAAAPAGTRMVWASAASGEYPVLVGRGLLPGAGADAEPRLAAVWPLDRTRSRPFCVSDETVAALYGGRVGDVATTVTIPAGESHKTLASAERVWRALVDRGMTRADHVVALGGGVVGDLAGFCAATYQRGVPVVHVPTTLVAQVDSAYGGKTGVDLPQAKNYVGAYHQPAGVLVDPDTLDTLPPAELSAGWVEVLKTALIAGGELWEAVAASSPVASPEGEGKGERRELDERVILACARTKLAVVAADERDGGRRQVLNLGHTIGHAIETATGYARYRHGEAVGLGLLAALTLSGQPQLRERVRALMLERELPVTLGDVSLEQIVHAIERDKKRVGERVPFVLVRAPGEVEHGCELDARDVRSAIEELAA